MQDEGRKRRRILERIGNYSIGGVIGHGNFAVVHIAKHSIANVKVALKIVNKSRLNVDGLAKIKREINILKSLNHPNIVKLYEVIDTEHYLCIVMEYAKNGELFDMIMEKGRIMEGEARRLFKQISSAVAYCHSRGVVHRDLKAENLLLDAKRDIKLIDFGFSNIQKPDSLLKTFCGSPPYAAPELLLEKAYDGMKADIWSLGVVLYVLVAGGFPFPGEINKLKIAVLVEQLKIPFWVSFACADLIRKMLIFHPVKRISITAVLQHRWLNESGSDNVQNLIPESSFGRLHPEETSGHLNLTVLLYMQQQTKWTEDQIVEAVANKNFESPIFGTYQLLCSKVRESYTVDDSFQTRRGSRGSITSGKVNVEVEGLTIPAHQFARLNLSSADNVVSDNDDTSNPDEIATSSSSKRRHSAQLGLVFAGEHSGTSSSSRDETRRHSLCTENLPYKSLLTADKVPLDHFTTATTTPTTTTATKTATQLPPTTYATNALLNTFGHSNLPVDLTNISDKSFYVQSRNLPYPSVGRRASAGEAVPSASDYLYLASDYAMDNLTTSYRYSPSGSRLKFSVQNNLTMEEEGEKYLRHHGFRKRNTYDSLFGNGSASTAAPSHIRFAGSPYAKQNDIERRRSWTSTNQPTLVSSQKRMDMERFRKLTISDEAEQLFGIRQLQLEFAKLKANTECEQARDRNSPSQNITEGIKCTPGISITDENNCCLRFSTPQSHEALCSTVEKMDEQPIPEPSDNSHLGATCNPHDSVISVICPYNTTETMRRLLIVLNKFNLQYGEVEHGLCGSPYKEMQKIAVSCNGKFLAYASVTFSAPFFQSSSKVEFVHAVTEAKYAKQLCYDICEELREKY